MPAVLLPKSTSAAVRCETQYGGREVCVTTGQLQVNKQVFCDTSLPGNEDEQICKDTADRFIDNMGINFHKFFPGEEIRFRIRVKNVGDATFSKVTVSDTPQSNFFELTSGSLNFDLTDLKPGETQERELRLRVLDTINIPANNVICVINSAEARADGEADRDTAQVCLERKVLGVEKGGVPPVKELPATGPEAWFLTLFGSAAGVAAGFRLRKYGRIQYADESYYQITENRFNMKGRG